MTDIKPILRRPRLVSRDKETFKIVALGRQRVWGKDIYIRLLDASWGKVTLIIALVYLLINLIFATAYDLSDGIENARAGSFTDMFFFSVQTMATIGYGRLVPVSVTANILVTLEAFIGFCFFAVVTGLVFAKFSRPTARVLFSDVAVVCPYDGEPHLMFRMANERGNRIVDARVQIVVLYSETTREGHKMRRFHDIQPVRSQVPLLQLSWTVMHKLESCSPTCLFSAEKMRELEAEIIVSLTGTDESLAQTIHARHSYIYDELRHDSMFEDVLQRKDDGSVEVDYRLFHSVKPLKLSGLHKGIEAA